MEAKEALKKHNENAVNGLCERIKRMIKESDLYGTGRDTYKLVILGNEFVDEDEQPRDDFIKARVFTVNIEMITDTI